MDLLARWQAMGPGQKFVLGSLFIGMALTIGISAFFANHVTYTVLYAGLEAEQASQVVDELRNTKIPFRLTDSGRTILVPEKHVYSARLDLAGKGSIGGTGMGYEIFDQSKFGMTSFMQQVNYRRALEGELTRTIVEMDGVMTARVHLVIPEKSLFLDGQRPPTASVMLRLKPGIRLSRKQIEGITALVSGSVDALSTDNVNILDYYGNLLSVKGSESGMGVEGTARFEVENSVERSLEEKAQSLLDRVVGPGNSVVRVTAELDFERLERNEEKFDADNPVVRSEEVSEEMEGEGGGEYRSTVTNYEINRTVDTMVKTPGNIKRLTVAVTVDGRYEIPVAAEGEENAEAEPGFVARSREELRELEALVKNAVGLNESRGDQFHIACVQFDHRYMDIEQTEMKSTARRLLIQTIIEKVLLIIGLVVAFLIIKKIWKSIATTVANATPAAPVTAAQSVAASVAASIPSAGVTAGGAASSTAAQISRMAEASPEESADMIRSLIGEDG